MFTRQNREKSNFYKALTKHNDEMSSSSSPSSSPPYLPQHSIVKYSNKIPPHTILSPPLACMSSSCADFSLPSLASSSDASATIVTIDPFAFAFGEEYDIDYEGSEHYPFICCINTKYPEHNRDGFHGHRVTLKRSLPNGDEYHYDAVVVTKTSNSADAVDLELWKASIPQKGDFA
jgi:hypothetical protein